MNKFQKLLWPLWRSRRKKIQIKGKKKRKRTSKERESTEDSSYSYNKYKNNISKGLRSSVYDINLWSALSLKALFLLFGQNWKRIHVLTSLHSRQLDGDGLNVIRLWSINTIHTATLVGLNPSYTLQLASAN
jgi:hypothetical protein